MGKNGTMRPHITPDLTPQTLEFELELAITRIREITEAAGLKRNRIASKWETTSGAPERVTAHLLKIEERGEKYGWNG